MTAPGLEELTARELATLGLNVQGRELGGVSFEASRAQLYASNLHLRTATRVLVRVAAFHARALGELERHAQTIAWDAYLPAGGQAHFRVTAKKSKLNHAGAIIERLGSAARRHVRDLTVVPKLDESSDSPGPQQFVVRLHRDQCLISADSSGALLHRRGYRQAVAKAPLRETLAAALLLALEWDGSVPLVDPMAGSGTIPIEAALIARRIAPGLERHFGFERWPSFDAKLWAELRSQAQALVRTRAPAAIVGSDRDPGAIAAARANAERAGVAADIQWEQRALSALALPEPPGLILTNPPYGARLGERLRLRDLYAQIGNLYRKRCRGWRLALLSSDRMLEGQLGLDLTERLRTQNGGLPVRLLAVEPSGATERTGSGNSR